MFAIEWHRRGSPVDKEISVLASETEVIVSAKNRALDVAKRHPGREPDSFRLTDATGKMVGAPIPLPRREYLDGVGPTLAVTMKPGVK